MSSLGELRFGIELERASDGYCRATTGFSFGHPGHSKNDSRYYVHTVDDEVTLQRIAGEPQALDDLPTQIALDVVGGWIRHAIINPLATTPPIIGEPYQCTVK